MNYVQIREIRANRFKDAVKPGFLQRTIIYRVVPSPKEKEEPKTEKPNPLPRIVYDDAMQQKKLIHETCTSILGIGVRYPFVC